MSVLRRSELEESPLADLHVIASELGLESYRTLRKADLIAAIVGEQRGEEAAVTGGAEYVRVHDVAAAADYLRVRAALRGELEVPPELRLAEQLRREAAASTGAH